MRQWETACETSQRGFRSSQHIEGTEVPAIGHISHDSDSERPTKVALKKRSFSIHFPKDRNCEVCLRTKMTRAPCRKRARAGNQVLWADELGDMITADHKVLIEGGDSGNNHRYSVMVQDSATQWIQSCPCNTQASQETERSLRVEPSEKPKVINTDNSLDFGKSCEDLS